MHKQINHKSMTNQWCWVLSWIHSLGCTPSKTDYNKITADKIWTSSQAREKEGFHNRYYKNDDFKFALHWLVNLFFRNIIMLQSVCWKYIIRVEGRYNQSCVPAIWPNQINQHVLGSADTEAQRFRIRRVWNTWRRSARPGTNEWRNDGRQKH